MPLTPAAKERSVQGMSLRRSCPTLLALLLLTLASPVLLVSGPAWADFDGSADPASEDSFGLEPSDDPDIRLTDTYFWLHLGSNAGTIGFGVGALVGGAQNLVTYLCSEPQFGITGGVCSGSVVPGGGGQQFLFVGLTLAVLGAASVINGVTWIEYGVRGWKSLRRAFALGSAAQRRILRQREIRRLRRRVKSHAMSLAVDGTSLGLGIALTILYPPLVNNPLITPLILGGAFILGLDIFQLVVDDQASRKWRARNREDSAGYFGRSSRRRGPQILAVGASPWLPVSAADGSRGEPGMIFSLAGVY